MGCQTLIPPRGDLDVSKEAILVLRALNVGARLHGRLDQAVPFQLSPPDQGPGDGTVPASLAEELHNAGWIEIDESAPIADLYVFQISAAGKEHVESL
jgi:hypothetical protein